MMRTWFQCHIRGGTPGGTASLVQRVDFGVLCTCFTMPATPDDLTVTDNDTANSRIGMRCIAAATCEL